MQQPRSGSIGSIVRVFAAFALFHSAVASRPAKQAASALVGVRYRNGLYRFLYNAVAVLQVIPLTVWFSRLDDRTLYRVPAPWSALFRAMQLASIGFAVAAAHVVDLRRITGIACATELIRNQPPQPEPEAQGPPLVEGQLRVEGPFRLVRHPLNLAPLGVFFFFPHMTVNRLTLALLSLAYLFVGSMHEEFRLRQAYGKPYQRYQRSGVPFYFPGGN